MIKRLITFQCEICGSTYAGKEAARTCEARGLRGKVEGVDVGTVVRIPGNSYAWHKVPDTAWVIRRSPIALSGHHDHEFAPLFIVTRIDIKDHEHRYHLYCEDPPWKENEDVFNFRWNTPATHLRMIPLSLSEVPEAITTWSRNNLAEWAPRIARDLL